MMIFQSCRTRIYIEYKKFGRINVIQCRITFLIKVIIIKRFIEKYHLKNEAESMEFSSSSKNCKIIINQ